MIKPLPFDELNTFERYAAEDVQTIGRISAKPKQMVDAVEDFLLIAYLLGYEAVNETMGTQVKPDAQKQYEAIYKNIAGKTFADRVEEYSISGSVEEIKRVAETDMTRVYNDAVIDAGNAVEQLGTNQRLIKIWSTMLDERVRSTHQYLEGMTAKLNEEFYTYDGDHALVPGGFQNPANNVNCRCQLDIAAG